VKVVNPWVEPTIPAVGENLDVNAEYTRVELRTPEVVKDEVPGGSTVCGGRKEEALGVQEDTEDVTEDCHGTEALVKSVVDYCNRVGSVRLEVPRKEGEHSHCDQETRETIVSGINKQIDKPNI